MTRDFVIGVIFSSLILFCMVVGLTACSDSG